MGKKNLLFEEYWPLFGASQVALVVKNAPTDAETYEMWFDPLAEAW